MVRKRSAGRLALLLAALTVTAAVGSAPAAATELADYLWERRPVLVFAPTDTDPRLVETLDRIEATRCDFVSRDMVLGVAVTEGDSTLGGQPISAEESQRLAEQFGIGGSTFTVLLIGKDGGEKWRVDEVPDLRTIYDVVDGMPMRTREMSTDPGRC